MCMGFTIINTKTVLPTRVIIRLLVAKFTLSINTKHISDEASQCHIKLQVIIVKPDIINILKVCMKLL